MEENETELVEMDEQDIKHEKRAKIGWIIFFSVLVVLIGVLMFFIFWLK